MTSPRALRDHITNALDFLTEAELILYANSVSLRETRVTWHAQSPAPFTIEDSPARPEQYLEWVTAGHYTATLPDASLIQLTYDVRGGEVTRHRLAYIPCPVLVDQQLLRDGAPIADLVELYLEQPHRSAIALRSPIRFDLDTAAASSRHPAAHFTLNESHCRIACVAPMHPYRFLDFVFRQFYPELRHAQMGWFDEAANALLGEQVIADKDRSSPHIAWDLHPGLRRSA